MTPDEIRTARHSLGMTHRQFGHALGVQEQTARRWEIDAGKTSNRAPSETVLRLIRVLLATNPKATDSDPDALSQAIAAARDCKGVR